MSQKATILDLGCGNAKVQGFRLVDTKIDFHWVYRMFGIQFFANLFIVRYEQFFAFLFRPQSIHVTLKVVK